MKTTLRLAIAFIFLSGFTQAQSPNATIAGRVLDPSNAILSDAKVEAINLYTNIHYSGQTNREGSFVIPNLPPGPYRIEVSKSGFKTAVREDVVLRVQDIIALNFTLPIGSVTESVTVTGGAPLVNTQDATVSTVVDRNFAENLPMNGRSFQSLIQLTPGVVVAASSAADPGQFSINGQRTDANYWTVDGVSANIGVAAVGKGGLSGSLGGFSAQGGTNSMVSIDAMQEFRLQTSTYAPEFGRQPGGQISILTRSGSNQFHGTLFEYLRNDALDANNWFNGYTNNPPLRKAEERQNNFGGTFGGPILKDRTFFFFSYEGNRLRLPRTLLTTVPSLSARAAATAAMQPFFNAYPMPNGTDNGDGTASLGASYSDASSLDAASLRIDHRLNNHLTLFARYNYAPSDVTSRGAYGDSPNSVARNKFAMQTATAGATWAISPLMGNDLRFNYSRNHSSSAVSMDGFMGAVPLSTLPLPTGYSAQNADFFFSMIPLGNGGLALDVGKDQELTLRQYNLVDTFYLQRGTHSLKFGVDYRRLSPVFAPRQYLQNTLVYSMADAESGTADFVYLTSQRGATFLFRNLGIYAEDTWRAFSRLTLTYGLRWDLDSPPSSLNGPSLLAFTGYNLQDPSNLAVAPPGTPVYKTTYNNFAPRIGVAYQLRQNPDWGTVLRGGYGLFYDMASSQIGNLLFHHTYPFLAYNFGFGEPFPLPESCSPSPCFSAAPPAFAPPSPSSPAVASGTNSNLKLPYTMEWNFSLEQALGRQQSLSATYVGAAGRRLLQTTFAFSLNLPPSFTSLSMVDNTATSDYHALQLQFTRQLSHGLQALVSYTWAHSIDTASAGSFDGNPANGRVVTGGDRASSDYDIRHAFSAAFTYQIPSAKTNAFASKLTSGWSVENILQARTAPPVNVFDTQFSFLSNYEATSIRPDVVPGVPLYLYGSQYPGGKVFNSTPGAGGTCSNGNPSIGPFCAPPTVADPIYGSLPARQGNLPRNALRGFGAWQWDFAVHRDFSIHESLSLQFRAEMFNVLNHPNFGPPLPDISPFVNGFGKSYQLLADSLDGGYQNGGSNQGGGSFSPVYQFGGPRTIQLALKLRF